MKKSIITLAVGAVLLGTLSVPSLGFAEQAQTSVNISSETSYTPSQSKSKWVTGIRGATVKEDMKSTVPTSKYHIEGRFAGDVYLYKWQEKGGHRVCPLYQGFLYQIIP
ncbi:hypothetical protein [Paenibacillus sp. S25]|uniref:hypothetical protein n=1 Tax=Paenibacillus sp. S25 TaxID=2823905 RepID=UPI001C652F99|nr:hypothetical protein [Paenibacillus sp. S25]QYK62604.1 hypothetical protein KAI37_02934 [Paenibacillus sp. S25]